MKVTNKIFHIGCVYVISGADVYYPSSLFLSLRGLTMEKDMVSVFDVSSSTRSGLSGTIRLNNDYHNLLSTFQNSDGVNKRFIIKSITSSYNIM